MPFSLARERQLVAASARLLSAGDALADFTRGDENDKL